MDVVIPREWDEIHRSRSSDLFGRFAGWYRAVVVETNDPLQMHRIRVKCPELHNYDLEPKDLPWASPAPGLGGKNTGSWISPCIGDIVFITWEKNHPYNPIYVGAADGTRRRRYTLESIYTKSPLYVDENGFPSDVPDDYIEDYLPKDFRPMSHGFKDRYGNTDVINSVGFFPKEHEKEPAQNGTDAVSKKNFDIGAKPKENNPDQKFMVRVSKYGTYLIQSDVGYLWKSNGDDGEFNGDFDEDIDWEVERTKYLTKLLSENKATGKDQRRFEVRTRYGHKIELRDVGWAQSGGGMAGCEDAGKTKTRSGEYGDPKTISKNSEGDERWVKFRTKGGHLIQMMDMGFHPEKDKFIKKKLIDEIGADADEESDAEWTKRDARMIRFVSRHGFKLVIDDRGSDPIDADGKEAPHGNGMLIKGRRSYSGSERGFGWEYNEKDELNTTRWYTPKSKIVEMNDKFDYVMMCTDTKTPISREYQKLKENEFALKVAMTEDPESDTYHLKLDKANKYVRLKTASELNQGIEARDEGSGLDGAWVEVLDSEDRGLWFTQKYGATILRSMRGTEQYIVLNSRNGSVIIRNNESGPVQIFSSKNVEIMGENVAIKADNRISLYAGNQISLGVGNARASLTTQAFGSNVNMSAPVHLGRLPGAEPGGGAQDPAPVSSDVINPAPLMQSPLSPSDRGFTDNGPFDEVEAKIIRICD